MKPGEQSYTQIEVTLATTLYAPQLSTDMNQVGEAQNRFLNSRTR
jgi:hypothetical protein